MPRATKAKTRPQLTTAQQLGSVIKSARDLMRKDKGLNGDLDRLPMLTWIMFLKFLDDLERMREDEAALAGADYTPAIEPPYRWRDWAAHETGITGDALIAFINNDEAVRPDGQRGPGLFAWLRNMPNTGDLDRRKVISTVFKGTNNRMINGYLLRELVNKINAIRFNASDEIHTLGHLYESMLKEMRDAAGDSGEFYTPRAVVRFMVAMTDPRLGETVLDPACGTGGFLAEAFAHLQQQCETVEQRRQLQERSIFGGEAKSLPYLLAQMNLLLHGLEAPQIDYGNSLRVNLAEMGEEQRVHVILTNPPFGGEEEADVQKNFPQDMRTAETALLFLQLIMRKLSKLPTPANGPHGEDLPARAAVVVPNGTLFGDGIAGKVKEALLTEFNVHTIVRLPNGVFAPYTSIPTNVIFFDRAGPTEDIWYYEQPLPEGRKQYTKTAPMQFEEFAGCATWWNQREENERAWKLNWRARYDDARERATPFWQAAEAAQAAAREAGLLAKELSQQAAKLKRSELAAANEVQQRMSELEAGAKRQSDEERRQRGIEREARDKGDAIYWPVFNLDVKNPRAQSGFEHLPPAQLADDILQKELRIAELMREIKAMLEAQP